jgi:hypothetical protein
MLHFNFFEIHLETLREKSDEFKIRHNFRDMFEASYL